MGQGPSGGAQHAQVQRGLQQGRLPHAGLAAASRGHAVAAVLLEVAVQVVRAHEGLEAAGALVGPQPGVHAHVVLQVVVVGEGGATLRAQVWLLPRVLPHVHLELVLSAEEKGKGIKRPYAAKQTPQSGAPGGG